MSERKQLLTRLVRLVQQQPDKLWQLDRALAANFRTLLPTAIEVAQQTGEPIGAVAAQRFASDGDAELAEEIKAEFPFLETTSLMRLARAIFERLAEALSDSPKSNDIIKRADYLRIVARCTYELGETERAADLAEQATVSVRDIWRLSPTDAITKCYYGCLSTLSLTRRAAMPRFASVGSDQASLDPVRTHKSIDHPQAAPVLVRCELCDKELAAVAQKLDKRFLFVPLNNKIQNLLRAGKAQEALKAAEELCEITGPTDKSANGEPRRDETEEISWASARTLYMDCLSALGRHVEAIALGETIRDTYLDREEELPDMFRDRVARFELNFGRVLLNANEPDHAREIVGSAVKRYRDLQISRNDYRINLAWSLTLMGKIEMNLGNRDPAIALFVEANDIYLRMADDRVEVDLPPHHFWVDERVENLRLAAICCHQNRQLPEALELMTQAMDAVLGLTGLNENLQNLAGGVMGSDGHLGTVLQSIMIATAADDDEKLRTWITALAHMLRRNEVVQLFESPEIQTLLEVVPAAVTRLGDTKLTVRCLGIFKQLSDAGRAENFSPAHLFAIRTAAHLAVLSGDLEIASSLAYRGAKRSLELPDDQIQSHEFASLLNLITRKIAGEGGNRNVGA